MSTEEMMFKQCLIQINKRFHMNLQYDVRELERTVPVAIYNIREKYDYDGPIDLITSVHALSPREHVAVAYYCLYYCHKISMLAENGSTQLYPIEIAECLEVRLKSKHPGIPENMLQAFITVLLTTSDYIVYGADPIDCPVKLDEFYYKTVSECTYAYVDTAYRQLLEEFRCNPDLHVYWWPRLSIQDGTAGDLVG